MTLYVPAVRAMNCASVSHGDKRTKIQPVDIKDFRLGIPFPSYAIHTDRLSALNCAVSVPYEPALSTQWYSKSMHAKIGWHFGRAVYCDPATGEPYIYIPPESVLPQPDAAAVAPLPAAAQAVLDENPGLTREEAARFLGISPSTLADWATKGRGPRYLDIGASVQYPLSELVEWQARQTKPSGPEPEPGPVKRRRGRPRTVPIKT